MEAPLGRLGREQSVRFSGLFAPESRCQGAFHAFLAMPKGSERGSQVMNPNCLEDRNSLAKLMVCIDIRMEKATVRNLQITQERRSETTSVH